MIAVPGSREFQRYIKLCSLLLVISTLVDAFNYIIPGTSIQLVLTPIVPPNRIPINFFYPLINNAHVELRREADLHGGIDAYMRNDFVYGLHHYTILIGGLESFVRYQEANSVLIGLHNTIPRLNLHTQSFALFRLDARGWRSNQFGRGSLTFDLALDGGGGGGAMEAQGGNKTGNITFSEF